MHTLTLQVHLVALIPTCLLNYKISLDWARLRWYWALSSFLCYLILCVLGVPGPVFFNCGILGQIRVDQDRQIDFALHSQIRGGGGLTQKTWNFIDI